MSVDHYSTVDSLIPMSIWRGSEVWVIREYGLFKRSDNIDY
jgi:hypothetical protein